ncbi:hypothetical protein ISN44_As09g019170 [Arabidopsis suecica]|uniref:CLAVATA3/ESR (CLE)-related protein 42 n=1 Tax=Arabidopsis suecica TaxID=45249 RepID=A0A8T2AJA5_ARASU|nr:hypothetical protein ISN44_As09g019170 [Arabidopsis suecica]
MRSPHIIISLVLFFFLSLILQTHQRTIDQTHRIGSNVQHVSDMAVTSPGGKRRERFRVRRPMTTWRKGKMLGASEHGVPSGPNPISNR